MIFLRRTQDFFHSPSPRHGTDRRKLPGAGGRAVRRIGVQGWNHCRWVRGRAGPGSGPYMPNTEKTPPVFLVTGLIGCYIDTNRDLGIVLILIK